ncbi:hypothetical protein [Kitasatospora sp. NPDC002965]|uniref:hypothetical protein n=1 Tax=Kitasatospora sp. NPDC002965 TaxID=3154775 RepID=UPI0033B163A0
MPTEIASLNTGRALPCYDLLDEITDATGTSRSDAHAAIHALLADIVGIDGEDAVILSQRPQRPDLVQSNPHDLDIDHWVTITDDAAQTIRAVLTAGTDETE